MAKFNMHLLLLTFMSCLMFFSDAVAAPAIKRFGTGGMYSGTTAAASAKTSTLGKVGSTNAPRATALRATGLKSKVNTVKTAKTSTAPNVSRLSAGKYLHAGGVIGNKITPSSSSTPSTAGIESRLGELEEKVNAKADKDTTYTKAQVDTALDKKVDKDDLNNYYTKDEINSAYVTKEEKTEIETDVVALKNDVQRIKDETGLGEERADDWYTQGLHWN